jgi:hypothetical protein
MRAPIRFLLHTTWIIPARTVVIIAPRYGSFNQHILSSSNDNLMYSSQVFIQKSPSFEKATPSGNEQSQMDQASLCGCNLLIQERTKYNSSFLDLENSIFILEPQMLLDMERSESQPEELGFGANIGAELRRISILQRLPRDGLRQQHPAAGEIKRAAKRKVQGFDRKLTAMLLPVHF